MDGIRITGQNLYAEERVRDVQEQARSILSSKGLDVESQYGQYGMLKGESFLNCVEVNLKDRGEGTSIEIDYGMTTLGVILTLVGLIIGVVIGALLVILWYLKTDELKSSFGRAYPGYGPPQHKYQTYGDQGQQ